MRIKKFRHPFFFLAIGLGFIIISILVYKISFRKQTPEECAKSIICPECNIVLITVDSLRADRISILGYERQTTPSMEKLAEKAIVFPNYFTTAFLTPITQMSLHTGMYPSSNGMTLFNSIIPANVQTLAQILKNKGWATSALHTAPEYTREPGTQISFSRGFNVYKALTNRELSTTVVNSLKNELMTLKERQFFLWFSAGNVHFPYGYKMKDYFTDPKYNGILKGQQLKWDLLTHYYNGLIYPSNFYTDIFDLNKPRKEDELLAKIRLTQKPVTLNKDDLTYINDMYDNGVRDFDNFFQQFVNLLRSNKILDKTIIVVTSEHGDDHNEHKYFAHHDIYDTLVHTPLVIYSPKIQSKMTVDSLASTVDILPTILSWVGLSSPAQVQGKNLTPTICGVTKPKEDEAVYIERIPLWEQIVYRRVVTAEKQKLIESIPDNSADIDIAIRTKEWKYILRRANPIMEKISWWKTIAGISIPLPEEELYNVQKDPYEQYNLIQKNPIVAKELREKLLKWWNITIAPTIQKGTKTFRIQEYF